MSTSSTAFECPRATCVHSMGTRKLGTDWPFIIGAMGQEEADPEVVDVAVEPLTVVDCDNEDAPKAVLLKNAANG